MEFYDYLIIGLSAFIVISFSLFLYLFLRDKRKTHNYQRNKGRGFLIKSYRVFYSLPFSKIYLEQIRKRYEMRFPEDIGSLMCRTMGTAYALWGASITAFIFLFGLQPTFYMAYLPVLSIAVLNKELLGYIVGNMEANLNETFNDFLSDVRHGFYSHGMIDSAMIDAAETCGRKRKGRIMKKNAEKMLNVLESNDKDTAIRVYNEAISNRFLRLFLSIALYVSEFGDKVVKNVSVFLQNINILKTDIYNDTMNRKETNFKFSGMIFVVLAPVYLLDGIKTWSLSITPDIAEFYRSTSGLAVRITIYVITAVMYVMINELKEKNAVGINENYIIKYLSRKRFIGRLLNNYEEKNRHKLERTEELLYRVGAAMTSKQFLLKRILYSLGLFIICIIIAFNSHRDNRAELSGTVKFMTDSSGVVSDRYLEAASEIVLKLVGKYKGSRMERTDIENIVRNEGAVRSAVVGEAIVNEIVFRLNSYEKEYFHWYELLLSIFMAGLGYWAPYWMLIYRRKVLYLNMGNEVAQFQSTIMIVMYLNNTTVLKVLELMESFSVIFKESLKQCINDYSAGDIDALERLKLRERYEPFQRIVDNLIIADKIGVQRAFDEVEEERKVSQEMRNQDYRITRDKKVVIGYVMAYVPAVITVAFYWIIPFALNSLNGLLKYDEIMNTMR